jgi:hypothetical protein
VFQWEVDVCPVKVEHAVLDNKELAICHPQQRRSAPVMYVEAIAWYNLGRGSYKLANLGLNFVFVACAPLITQTKR